MCEYDVVKYENQELELRGKNFLLVFHTSSTVKKISLFLEIIENEFLIDNVYTLQTNLSAKLTINNLKNVIRK